MTVDFLFFDEHHYRFGTGDVVEGETRYQHKAGGPARHKGVKDPVTGRSAIPLFEFDLTDPYLGIRIPGVTRLPFYFTFFSGISSYAYRVLSDEEIELILPETGRYELTKDDRKKAATFDAKYSKGLPAETFKVLWYKYNCFDPEDYEFRKIFYQSPMRPGEKKELLRRLNAHYQEILKRPATSLEEADRRLPDVLSPLKKPESYCPNPKCRKGKSDLMKLLFIPIPDSEEEPLFSAMGGPDDSILAFTWCIYCRTIGVTIQCK